LGDHAAGTVVAYREPAARHAAVPEAPPVTPPVPLGLDEQRTVLDYATRAGSLTQQRAEELALLAPRLTGTHDGALARERLLGIASFLVGRRA